MTAASAIGPIDGTPRPLARRATWACAVLLLLGVLAAIGLAWSIHGFITLQQAAFLAVALVALLVIGFWLLCLIGGYGGPGATLATAAYRPAVNAGPLTLTADQLRALEVKLRDAEQRLRDLDVSVQQKAQSLVRANEARFDRAQEIAGIGSWELDVATGRFVWSKQMYRLRGFDPDKFKPTLESLALYTHTDDVARERAWLADLQQGQERDVLELRILDSRREVRVMLLDGRGIEDDDGVIRRVIGTMQDVTERRLMEHQLVQAQKMEAIGSLTGGMAHDFNNILGVIIGNLHLLAESLQEMPDRAELCADALSAARRGADLTRRLLAFARRQPLSPEPTDVNLLITNLSRLLNRILGEDVQIDLRLGHNIAPVMVDPVQLEAAITNLATNARDAMPHGGQLTIVTRRTRLDREYAAQHTEASTGEYVLIEVSDTGVGMTQEVAARAFEPYFTTKEQGKGTGLGLSMVFGFSRQSGGHVNVYSERGRGTTLRLYLPYRQEGATAAIPPARKVLGGHECVLIVEDNGELRRITVRQLQELGYTVLEADSGAAALDVVQRGGAPDLLLSDIVMPGALDGIELARRIVRRHPDVRVLLMSGFSEVRFSDHVPTDLAYRLISKPFDRDELGVAVREALDAPVHQDRDTIDADGPFRG